jgi:hypothetical protein
VTRLCGYDWGRVDACVGGWKATCPCGWEGETRRHPLDCGSDLLVHQLKGTPEAETSEAVSATSRAGAS